MNTGKKKCRVLRGIRKRIAEANGIHYAPHKCTHKGDCEGTCPACEQEMHYLETEIHKRRISGRAAMVVGTALGIGILSSSMSSCRHAGQVVGKVPSKQQLVGDVPADGYLEEITDSDSVKVTKVEELNIEH
ncbi:MAG: hypothetical protein J5678_03195 [Bacteroidaceae bacterium]|nr:hypothetical protein [Bacteroidaceae bacterium]